MSNWWPLLFKTELKNISQILLCFFFANFLLFIQYTIYNNIKHTKYTIYKFLPPFTRTWTILPGNWFFPISVNPLNLESQNQATNIPVGLPVAQSKFEANRSSGSWVMIVQTNKQRLKLTIYIKKLFAYICMSAITG